MGTLCIGPGEYSISGWITLNFHFIILSSSNNINIFYKFHNFLCPLIPSHWDNCRALQPYVLLLMFWQTPQFYTCGHFGRYLVIDFIQIPASEILQPLCWALMHRYTSVTVNDLAHWLLPTLLGNYHYIHPFALRYQLSICWLPLT